jgi:ElaB/YqjD/DUF883 family membrane-anchored ribosome-binding protein
MTSSSRVFEVPLPFPAAQKFIREAADKIEVSRTRAKEADVTIRQLAVEHPFLTLGAAAMLGFVVGRLFNR